MLCVHLLVGIYVDHVGAWLLVEAKKELQVGNARSNLMTVLAPMDIHETSAELTSRKSMEQSVRPFDELDKVRLDAWHTVAVLKPECPSAPKPDPPASELPKTLKELADTLSDSKDEDPRPRMCPSLTLSHA